jgi:hypothetical protein
MHSSHDQNDDARSDNSPQPPARELNDTLGEHQCILSSRQSKDKTSPTQYTKDIIRPVEEYITKWPAPKQHVTVGRTGLLRDKDWTDKASDTSNEHMVALRLQHGDLSSIDYTEADYVLLELSVINENSSSGASESRRPTWDFGIRKRWSSSYYSSTRIET